MIGAALDWAHLSFVTIVLCLSTLGQYVLLAFNALFPFPRVLEWLHRRCRPLQSLFRANLGMRTAGIEGRRSARELAEAGGFRLEDHHAVTADGFVLVLHRLVDPDRVVDGIHINDSVNGNSNGSNGEASKNNAPRPAVLLMHGLMQDSESLLCGGRDHALGLRLAAAGFDVFLGNARGNRYSHKHLRLSPVTSDAYWDFSIDELARYDTPAMFEQVLKVSGQSKLYYIGFSQGTAQGFAAFSSNPDLLVKVHLFVALSPAVRANHLSKSLLLSLVQANLRFINLLFGKRRMLPVALTWQRMMNREFFVSTIDAAVAYLFSWTASQISAKRKREIYPHIYSYSSVKCVLHWFQMMYSGRLSMFADGPASQYIPVTYDVARVSCPVAIVYGGRDYLVEVESLVEMLPNVVMTIREEKYEHLDTMWADSAKDVVFPRVETLIRQTCQDVWALSIHD
ncbi:unnamed protein product [Pylaiella littoralis]